MFRAHRRLACLLAASTVTAGSSMVFAQATMCCEPWDNGSYDWTGAQTSQTGLDQQWREFGRITFDDFWLCEGSVYQARRLRGVLCTDSLVPKARIIIVRDCDGRPDLTEGGIIGVADSAPIDTRNLPLGAECRVGSVTITETGNVNSEGFRILEVEATFGSLWLGGGAYWVAIIGYSGNADPLDQFFWGFAGNGVVKGRPGVFYNSDDGSITDADQLCCGCTDFAFCFEAEECKILLDNGGPDLAHYAPSLANPGSTFRESRAADDIVVSNCEDRRLCFVEGYLLTNCYPPRARLDVYDNDCKLPVTFAPPSTFEARCIYDTGLGVATQNGPLNLYKVQFWGFQALDGTPYVLQQNKNYWLSIYGVGTGSQTQQAYFVGAQRCDLICDGRSSHFNEAAVSGRGVGRIDASWIPVSQHSGSPFDLSLLVATDEVLPIRFRGDTIADSSCPADADRNGSVNIQDLFAFLSAWFTGCP